MINNINLDDLDTFSSIVKEHIVESFKKKDKLIETVDYLLKEELFTKSARKTLSKLKEELEKDIDLDNLLEDSVFAEIITFHVLKNIFVNNNCNVTYKCGSTEFPDITITTTESKKYGFEIKRVSGDNVLGNSSTQKIKNIDNFKEIYAVSFFDDGEQIHVSKYEDIIMGIDVDHNPRFRLKNMASEKSAFNEIFSSGNLIEYFKLPQNEREKLVANYLRIKYQDDEERWFLGQSTDIIAEFLENLQSKKLNRAEVRTYIFTYHPEIFSKSNYNFLRKEILKKYKYIGPVKDIITAGGKKAGMPRIFHHFLTLLYKINSNLEQGGINKEEWKDKVISSINKKDNLDNDKKRFVFKKIMEIVK
jgi:hypothetical protein